MEKLSNNKEPIIKISGVKKQYRLGMIGGGSLREELESWWAKKRGKDDPNSIVGQDERLVGKKFMALNGVDLVINRGEAIGIIGGNGAGKSTLLKLLCRVTAPSAGKIELYGRITSMLEVGTGFNGEMTGRENIYMNGAILGMSKQEIDKKIDDIIEFSEVKDFIDTPVKRYSSGMFVKLGFAVASHLESEIMIMDEVLAVGDMAFQKKCLNRMKAAVTEEGRTVLYVSHNMNTIRQLCDRCIVLDKGRIVFDGDIDRAIALYSGNVDENAVHYDLLKMPRDGNKSYRVQLCELTLVGKEENWYEKQEKVVCCVRCKCNKSTDSIKYRFEIYYEDGTVVGSMLSDKDIEVTAGTMFDVELSFSISNFAPGRYYAILLAYEDDGLGHQMDTDRVEPAMYFEVRDKSEGHLEWLHRYWGHIQFDPMTINKTEIVEYQYDS